MATSALFPMPQNRSTSQSSNDTPGQFSTHTARTRPVSTPVPLPLHDYMTDIEQANYMRPHQLYAQPYGNRPTSQDHHRRYYQYRKQNMFGPYLMLQTLGEGEFGKVKLGMHIETQQEVAIKLIRKESVDNSTRLSKVEREISVLRTVRHPYIVKLYDVLETEKYIGIILECASGGELFEYILARRYLKEQDACRLFAQLISGVHYLHQKHIVHRDLKLENLLLDRNRNVIITDFGFANQFNSAKDDLMATSCGSPCYAAPELVVSEGLYVGSAVDIWSCGVILYAMLCGYLPFDDDPANPDGDNINLLYKHILSSSLVFPDYVSPMARDLLDKMLVPDPTKRCDIQTIMDHPWLQQYRSLFAKSVRELEFQATTSAELTLSPVGAEAYRYAQQSLGLQEFSASRNTFSSDYDLGLSEQMLDNHSTKDMSADDEAVVPSSKEVTSSNSDSSNSTRKGSDVAVADIKSHFSVQMNQVVPMNTEEPASITSPKPSRTHSTAVVSPEKTMNDPLSPKPGMNANDKRGNHRKGYSTEKFFSIITGGYSQSTSIPKSTTFGGLKRNNTMNLSPTPSSTKSSSNTSSNATPSRNHNRFGSVSIARGTGSILHAKFLSSISGSPSRRSVHVDESPPTSGPWPGTSVSASILPSNTGHTPKSPLYTPARALQPIPDLTQSSTVRGTRRKAMSLLVTPAAAVESSEEDSSGENRWLGAETGRKALAFARRASIRNRSRPDKSAHDSDRDSGTMEGIVEDEAPAKESQDKDRQKTTGKKMIDWIKKKSNLRDIRSPISISSSPFDQIGRSFAHASMRGRPQSGSHWAPEETKLRIYHGAVDQSALTSRSPNDVFNEVKKTLASMGIDVKSEGDYKVKCTRRKRKSGRVIPPSTNASVDTFDGDSGMSLSMADQKKRRGVAGTATIRNLLRRSSAYSHESIPHQRHTSGSDDDGVAPSDVAEQRHASKQCTSSSLNSTVSGKPVAPIYGDESVDSGDEIRFSVELCKFKNLHGLYIVDIRRMRGNVWGYKFVYHQLLEALDLYRKGGYIPGPERQPPPPSNPIMATDSKKNTDFNGLGSIAEIKV
ncbi:hypothetical protein K450DRAFT_239491 [Umbelopsis ramanniana AG]|uniref:non-specific serine/threonine protein kinase n=1 Tax=Umbelopsis ramanniana AG TaxID=1314678 RepID=A0AAD5EAV7_UMBRA|nr:uncharacterized protein K450DRAFT_239491 [Umbelopsis ramanniana AG]KAI8579874.1 hypothetical protein K450DRAFT_239491 [Umbelopsis ramanniana AG]